MRNLSNLYVDGVVGIGTTSPSKKLHVIGDAWINRPSNKVDNNGATEFGSRVEFNNSFVSGQSGYMVFRYPTYNNFLIGGDYDGNIGGGIPNIQFGRSNGTVYMHIDANGGTGNVGIGTTSPGAKLDVYNGNSRFWHGGTSYYTQFDTNNEINTYTSAGVISTMYLNYKVGGDVNIARGAIVAKSAGNVGIGTTTPQVKLDVNGHVGIVGSNYLYFGHNTSNIGAWTTRQYSSGSTHYFNAQTFIFNNEGYGSVEAMRIQASSGNVGIGTTSPAAKLDISGGYIRLQQTASYANGWSVYNSNGYLSSRITTDFHTRGWGWEFTDNYPDHATPNVFFRVGYNGAVSYLTSGNFGIGTTSPTTKLDVNGVITATGGNSTNWNTAYSWGNHATAGYLTSVSDVWVNTTGDTMTGSLTFVNAANDVRINKNNNWLNLYDPWNNIHLRNSNSGYGVYIDSTIHYWRPHDGSAYWMTLNSTGLGIGTTSPSYKLHVSTGNTNVAARLENTTSNGSVLELYSSGDGRLMTLQTDHIYLNGGALHFGAENGALFLRSSGYGTVIGGTTVYSTGGNAALSVIGDVISFGASNNDLSYFRRLGVGQFQWQTYNSGNNGEIHLQPYGGNVGIGTTSPSRKLEVQGDFYVNGTNGALTTENSQSNLYLLNLTRSTTSLTTAGNVGIGTTSPSQKLHVAGKLLVSNGSLGGTAGDSVYHAEITGARHHLDFKEIRTANGTDWMNTTYKLQMRVDSTNHQSIDFVSDANALEHIDILTGNQQFNTRFTYDGKVGIGTTSPSGSLHVYKSAGQANVIVDAGGNNAYFFANNGANWGLWGFQAQPFTLATNGSERFRITSDGNVGIGTTSPYSNVTLQYTGNNLAGSYFGNLVLNATTDSTWNRLRFDRGGVARFGVALSPQEKFVISNLYTNGTTADPDDAAFVIAQNSNVGIGTTSPAYKLDVNGNSRTTGIHYVDTYLVTPYIYGGGPITMGNDVIIDSNSAWNASAAMLNVGGTGDGRIQVRHIYGKSDSSANPDHLWLQYQNTGKHVQIGDSGGGNNLYVSGNIYMNGYLSGNLVATQSWVGSQGYATQTYVNTAIANLVDSAPGTLDTLNELAAALGDDPNFATTVTNSIATKLPLAGGTMSGSIDMNGNNVINIGQVNATHAIFTNDGSSRVMYLRGSGNIIQFQDAAATNKWEVVGREGEFYVYKNDGAGSGFAWRVNASGQHVIYNNLQVNGIITETSSIKIKENVETSNGHLEKVNNLRPVSYNKIGSQNTELGLIAEEVAEVYPEFVQYDENGEPVGVHYSRLTAALIGAVKELTQRIEKLENNG